MAQNNASNNDKKLSDLASKVKALSKTSKPVTKRTAGPTRARSVAKKVTRPTASAKPIEYLVAPKEIYAIWFRAYQLILNSTDKKIVSTYKKNKKFYKDWGTDATLSFTQWWNAKAGLFEDKGTVEVAKSFKKDANHAYLSVPLNKKLETVVAQFREKIKPMLMDTQKQNLNVKHKFSPTINKGLKTNKIIMLLDLYEEVFNQKFKNKKEQAYKLSDVLNRPKYAEKVPKSLQKYHEVYEAVEDSNTLIKTIVENVNLKELSNAKRYINRYQQKVNRLLLNVAEGNFPGKY